MENWKPAAPTPSDLGDRELPQLSDALAGKQIALMVSGSIAAFKTPMVARELRRHGAAVTTYASRSALRYVSAEALAWSSASPVITELSAEAEHLSDTRPFDAYLLAPATYNSINKLAAGIADTVITSALASALGRVNHSDAQLLIAPAMHGSLHNPIFEASIERLQQLGVKVIPPRDAYGKHNLPDEQTLVGAVIDGLKLK
ncbi:MAG: flavoprotein [Immundisolibacteraceae bacterium]|nr:flavoprotein [Immundisolibacteraceae bacterium]